MFSSCKWKYDLKTVSSSFLTITLPFRLKINVGYLLNEHTGKFAFGCFQNILL